MEATNQPTPVILSDEQARDNTIGVTKQGHKYRDRWCDTCNCLHRYFTGWTGKRSKPVPPDESDLSEVEARADAATEGPWGVAEGNFIVADIRDGEPSTGFIVAEIPCQGQPNDENDLRFIAHARADIPALCQTVRALRQWNQEGCLRIAEMLSERESLREQLAELRRRNETQAESIMEFQAEEKSLGARLAQAKKERDEIREQRRGLSGETLGGL